jgi:peptidoglycan/xylan/chitin deacetylase (PgdA/CDA1 family)
MKRKHKLLIGIMVIGICLSLLSFNAWAYTSYQIKAGDSLFKISRQYNTNVSTLSSLNKIKNPNLIYTNQQIKLPDNKQSARSNSSSNSTTNQNNSNNYSSSSDSSSYNYSSNSNNKTTASSNFSNWQDNSIITAQERTKTDKKKIYYKKSSVNQVALTFDDGPDSKYTPQILDILKEHNVKATFFLLGKLSQKYQGVVKRIAREGHTIANHTWSHANLTQLETDEVEAEVEKTTKIIKEITNRKVNLLRPPYGHFSNELREMFAQTNYEIIHWSVDTLDWRAKNKQEIIDKVEGQLHNGAIILLHSAGGPTQDLTPTVQALPELIEEIKARGLDLVTVDDLLNLPAYS